MKPLNSEKLKDYWLESSADDLQSAKDIVTNTKSYIQGLFFLHLAIEKVLKALFVRINAAHAPLSHNLLNLLKKCDLEIVESKMESTLVEINEINLEMRYPEDLKILKEKVSKEYARNMIAEGEKVYQWILEKLK